MLDTIGCNIEKAREESFLGIKVNPGPALVFKPDFCCCPNELDKRFPFPTSVRISDRSTLVVRGSGVVIESLRLDGALVIDYPNGQEVVIKNKVVNNAGWVHVRDADSPDEVVQMRGYRIKQEDTEVLKSEDQGCIIL